MKKNTIMNNLIVFLAITGIYQTSILWLNQVSGKTIPDFISDSINFLNKEDIQQGNVLLATRYAIGIGDGFFSLYYPDNVGESLFLEETNNILDEILSDRNIHFQDGKANWKELLKNKTVILQYDFLVKGSDYLSNYINIKENQLPDEFDYLIIMPAERLGAESKAYFINSITDEAVCYTTNKSQIAPAFHDYLYRTSDELTYISTSERMNSSILERNLFLPQWANLPYVYNYINEVSVFGQAGAVNQVVLESVVKNFFNNFSMDWNSSSEVDDFMFSDNETIVRYNPNNQSLEYFNYSTYGNVSEHLNLLDGYQISCNFLKNDPSLTTDIYLTNIAKNNEETIYSFDYVVNNIPVILSETTKENLNRDYAISVTIKNDVVKNYKRYMVNYVADTSTSYDLTVPFIDAIDSSIKSYKAIDTTIVSRVNDIYLGYYIDSVNDNTLKWFIDLYDNLFIIDTDEYIYENQR